MNILVLNGSPRPHGNTAALVDAFTDEAQKAGHHVSVFQIGNKDIRGCKNCDACRATLNGNCVQKDDMQEICSPLFDIDIRIGTFCVWQRKPKRYFYHRLQSRPHWYRMRYIHITKKMTLSHIFKILVSWYRVGIL